MIITSDLHLKPESEEVVFDALGQIYDLAKTHGHKRVAILGDVYHVRYAVPVETQNKLHALLRSRKDEGFYTDILAGNHDQVDVSGQNALQVLEDVAHVHSTPHSDHAPSFGGGGVVAWVPYRKDPKLLEAFMTSVGPCSVAFVHHGLVGAVMNNGIVASPLDGLSIEAFQKVKRAFFGHWHRHQQIGNCVFVGSPWQTKADEHGQVKGVIELDEETLQWQFLPLHVGKRYWRVDNGESAGFAKPGDVITLPQGVSPQVVQTLTQQGLDVHIDPPKQESAPVRFNFGKNAPLRPYAQAYVDANGGDLDKSELMSIFDEVVSAT